MRHAKSSWKDLSLPDSKRPLNKRGMHDAPMMGIRLKNKGYCCDYLISSPAIRAYETAKAVAQAIGYASKIVTDDALYMAGTDDYLSAIAGVDESVNTLMIVSHNPGTEEFFTYLTGKRVAKFPTAAYALIEIDGPWSQLGKGKLLEFDYPKSGRAQ